jgi:hypothetical protein
VKPVDIKRLAPIKFSRVNINESYQWAIVADARKKLPHGNEGQIEAPFY